MPEQVVLNVNHVPAVHGDDRRMLRSEYATDLGHVGVSVVRPERGDAVRHRLQNPHRLPAYVIVHVVGAGHWEDGDRARPLGEPSPQMKRRPDRLGRVLGDTKGVFGGRPLTALVTVVRSATADVPESEPGCPADTGIGPVTWPKATEAGVGPETLYDGSVEEDERRHRMSGGLDSLQVERRVYHAPCRRSHNWKVLR
jgi:hypothetical protein